MNYCYVFERCLKKSNKMNNEQFLLYFKKKEIASDPNNSAEVTITNVVTSATDDIAKAELAFVEDEIQKLCSRPQQYQKAIPEKEEVGMYANIFGTASALKTYLLSWKKNSDKKN